MAYYVIGDDKGLKDVNDILTDILVDYQPVITSGTTAPTGGNDGDIYIQYEA